MKLIDKDFNLKYRHVVEYNGNIFTRKESMSPQSFCWAEEPNVLRDSHTIEWYIQDGVELYEYYSCDSGWSGPDNHCRPHWPVPEIEIEFKKNIGKDLYYFNNIETPKIEN